MSTIMNRLSIAAAAGFMAVSFPLMSGESLASESVMKTGTVEINVLQVMNEGIGGAPARVAYTRPRTTEIHAPRVSVASEIDVGGMLMAILGLISMRLWRGSGRNLLAVE